MSVLGNLTRLYRLNHGLSQRDFYKITGITPVTLSRIEKGDNKLTEKVFMKLLKVIEPRIFAEIEMLDEQAKQELDKKKSRVSALYKSAIY